MNYLTGLGFPDHDARRLFRSEGSRRVHVVGKNVWKFHAVYWPALLLSAGLPLPDQIVVHGFLTQDGRKISKSHGPVADPLAYVRRFGADAVRYFLLRHVRPFDDADFSEVRLAEAYEAELANGLGNLASRLTALCERFGVAGAHGSAGGAPPGDHLRHLREYRFDRALEALWAEVDRLNREIAAARPWRNGWSGPPPRPRRRSSAGPRSCAAWRAGSAPSCRTLPASVRRTHRLRRPQAAASVSAGPLTRRASRSPGAWDGANARCPPVGWRLRCRSGWGRTRGGYVRTPARFPQFRRGLMVMTVLEAHVAPDRWEDLVAAYEGGTVELPLQMERTFLLQSTADATLWRMATVWKDLEALEEYRRSVETPGGVLLFRSVEVEPTLSIFRVAAHAGRAAAP